MTDEWISDDGSIRLICGDCLEVLPTLEAGSVAACITDPPYGIDYQSARRIDRSQWKPKIANDEQPFVWFLPSAFRVCASPSCILCFCRWDVQDAFRLAMGWAGWEVKSQVIWDRESHGMGDLNGSPAPQHDVLWFGVKGGFKFPGARPKSVIRSLRLGGEQLLHPNQKPDDLMQALVEAYSPPGGMVIDTFMGSGSTIRAAIRSGRRAIGIETSREHYETALASARDELDRYPLIKEPTSKQVELFGESP